MRLNEFGNEKLSQYKTAAAADAKKADATGDFSRGHKRFKGINAATKKQFANDAKKQGVAEGSLNEFSQGSGGGESGRWYTDDEMTDIVGDGWWQDMDVSGTSIGVLDSEVPKEYMIQQAQAWLDDQGYSVQVLNCRLNDDDMDWYIEGSFQNPGFAKKGMAEEWSQKYKSSINCSHPKGFSQKAHCAGKKKHNESIEMEMVCEDCGMCQTHGSLNEIAKGAKDANGVTKCWPGKHAEGTKTGKNGGQVRNCVPNESVEEEAKHGLYYNVNKRKAAGTSRPASSPKAPTAQAWKDAAKTAKNESVAEDSLSAMRRLAGVTTPPPAAPSNGPRQYRHMPTAVQPR